MTKPIRPVRCWVCAEQMHYKGHPLHQPEVRLTIDAGDDDEIIYLHARCLNALLGFREAASGVAAGDPPTALVDEPLRACGRLPVQASSAKGIA